MSLSVSFCPLSVDQGQEVLHDTFFHKEREEGHSVGTFAALGGSNMV